MLLDYELARVGMEPEAINGYAREEHTHLAVAAAVAAGRADCGLGVLAAARAFGLDFVPVAREPYDLVLLNDSIEDELLRRCGPSSNRRTSGSCGGAGRLRHRRNGPPDSMMSTYDACVHNYDTVPIRVLSPLDRPPGGRGRRPGRR